MIPNVYGSASRGVTFLELTKAYREFGWISQKIYSNESYEIENEWSEMIIENAESEFLIHGCVLEPEQHIPKLGAVLNHLALHWSFEIYGPDKELLDIIKSESKN